MTLNIEEIPEAVALEIGADLALDVNCQAVAKDQGFTGEPDWQVISVLVKDVFTVDQDETLTRIDIKDKPETLKFIHLEAERKYHDK